MIATHIKPEYAEQQMRRVSVVSLPWDQPEPERETPVGRINDTPQPCAFAPRPRIAQPDSGDTFCNHDEDALRLMMQRLDGVKPEKDRFPRSPQPVRQLHHTQPDSLSQRVIRALRTHGPIKAGQLAMVIAASKGAVWNALSDHRAHGRAARNEDNNDWSAT